MNDVGIMDIQRTSVLNDEIKTCSMELSQLLSTKDKCLKSNIQPPDVPQFRRISSRDNARVYPDALTWMNREFSRLGWTRHNVGENVLTGEITGNVSKISFFDEENFRAEIDRNTTLRFRICGEDRGVACAYVSKFQRRYRVYHEFAFDHQSVYYLWSLFEAETHNQVRSWTDSMVRNGRYYEYKWFVHSLCDEEDAHLMDATRRQEINRVLGIYNYRRPTH